MAGGDVFQTLLGLLSRGIEYFPDPRRGSNTQYSMRDIGLSAFGVFFCQSPSFLSHQKLIQQSQGTNNAYTLFGVDVLLTDNHVRKLLDPVEPKKLRGVFRDTFTYLKCPESPRSEITSFSWNCLDRLRKRVLLKSPVR